MLNNHLFKTLAVIIFMVMSQAVSAIDDADQAATAQSPQEIVIEPSGEGLYSVYLQNAPLTEVLQRLSVVTGIEFYLQQNSPSTLNADLSKIERDQLITKLFRNLDIAQVWGQAVNESGTSQEQLKAVYLLEKGQKSPQLELATGQPMGSKGANKLRVGHEVIHSVPGSIYFPRPEGEERPIIKTVEDGAVVAYVADELVVQLKKGKGFNNRIRTLDRVVNKYQGVLDRRMHRLGYLVARFPVGTVVKNVADEIAKIDWVIAAEPNYLMHLTDNQTAAQTAEIVQQQKGPQQEKGAIFPVALIDTGVDFSDATLAGTLFPGADIVNRDLNSDDDHGHGTRMARLIHQQSPNTPIYVVKAVNHSGVTTHAELADAIFHTLDQSEIRLINLSLGGYAHSKLMANAVEYAQKKGVVIVASAGNDGKIDVPFYPAAYPNVVGVGALSGDDTVAEYSNQGLFVDLVEQVADDKEQSQDNGTSAAAAIVSGKIAIIATALEQRNRETETANVLIKRLYLTASDVGVAGVDSVSGYGAIQVHRAIDLVKVTEIEKREMQVSSAHGQLDEYQVTNFSVGEVSEDYDKKDFEENGWDERLNFSCDDTTEVGALPNNEIASIIDSDGRRVIALVEQKCSLFFNEAEVFLHVMAGELEDLQSGKHKQIRLVEPFQSEEKRVDQEESYGVARFDLVDIDKYGIKDSTDTKRGQYDGTEFTSTFEKYFSRHIISNLDVKKYLDAALRKFPSHLLYSEEFYTPSFTNLNLAEGGTDVGYTKDHRTPIILIHGWQGDDDSWATTLQQMNEVDAWWELAEHSESVMPRDSIHKGPGNSHPSYFEQQDLFMHYKVYRFRYPTGRSNEYNAKRLAEMVKGHHELYTHDDIILVGHSTGGLLAKYAMLGTQDSDGNVVVPSINEKVQRVITLASPHRGTFSAWDYDSDLDEWIMAYTNQNPPQQDKLFYSTPTANKYTAGFNMGTDGALDLSWDGGWELEASQTGKPFDIPNVVMGGDKDQYQINAKSQALNNRLLNPENSSIYNKFIFYGGYIDNSGVKDDLLKEGSLSYSPTGLVLKNIWEASKVVKAYSQSAHDQPVANIIAHWGQNDILMKNDVAVPIPSALLLQTGVRERFPPPATPYIVSGNYRVFDDYDHSQMREGVFLYDKTGMDEEPLFKLLEKDLIVARCTGIANTYYDEEECKEVVPIELHAATPAALTEAVPFGLLAYNSREDLVESYAEYKLHILNMLSNESRQDITQIEKSHDLIKLVITVVRDVITLKGINISDLKNSASEDKLQFMVDKVWYLLNRLGVVKPGQQQAIEDLVSIVVKSGLAITGATTEVVGAKTHVKLSKANWVDMALDIAEIANDFGFAWSLSSVTENLRNYHISIDTLDGLFCGYKQISANKECYQYGADNQYGEILSELASYEGDITQKLHIDSPLPIQWTVEQLFDLFVQDYKNNWGMGSATLHDVYIESGWGPFSTNASYNRSDASLIIASLFETWNHNSYSPLIENLSGERLDQEVLNEGDEIYFNAPFYQNKNNHIEALNLGRRIESLTVEAIDDTGVITQALLGQGTRTPYKLKHGDNFFKLTIEFGAPESDALSDEEGYTIDRYFYISINPYQRLLDQLSISSLELPSRYENSYLSITLPAGGKVYEDDRLDLAIANGEITLKAVNDYRWEHLEALSAKGTFTLLFDCETCEQQPPTVQATWDSTQQALVAAIPTTETVKLVKLHLPTGDEQFPAIDYPLGKMIVEEHGGGADNTAMVTDGVDRILQVALPEGEGRSGAVYSTVEVVAQKGDEIHLSITDALGNQYDWSEYLGNVGRTLEKAQMILIEDNSNLYNGVQAALSMDENRLTFTLPETGIWKIGNYIEGIDTEGDIANSFDLSRLINQVQLVRYSGETEASSASNCAGDLTLTNSMRIACQLFNRPYAELNGDYNNWGEHPEDYDGIGHAGIDIQTKNVAGGNPQNNLEPFYSVSRGEVIAAENGTTYNRVVVYDAAKDISVIYLHAHQIEVTNGMHVQVGARLGIQGAAGIKDGDAWHVHLEVRSGRTTKASFNQNGTLDPVANIVAYLGDLPLAEEEGSSNSSGGASTSDVIPSKPLNDTSITRCGNASSNDEDCPVADYPGQDGEYATNGRRSHSFTKLDSSGNTLPDSATEWSCVKDNVTGLIWQIKASDGGLHDKQNTFTWFNSESSINGGNQGVQGGDNNICYGYENGSPASYCNTEAYVARVNNVGLCGNNDWRLPDREELISIVDYSRYNLSVDVDFFPNTKGASNSLTSSYWVSSTSAYDPAMAWLVVFKSGGSSETFKSFDRYVRLVRSGHNYSYKKSNDGLIGYYKFDGDLENSSLNGSFDEKVYGVVYDIGAIGDSVYLDGVNDYVSIDGVVMSGEQLSFSIWVNFSSLKSENPILDRHGSYMIRYKKSGELGFYLAEVDDTTTMWVDVNLSINEWSHIAGVYDGSSQKLYFNGKLISERVNSGVFPNSSYPLYVLSDKSGVYWYSNGYADDFRIYDRALTSSEISSLFDAGNAQ